MYARASLCAHVCMCFSLCACVCLRARVSAYSCPHSCLNITSLSLSHIPVSSSSLLPFTACYRYHLCTSSSLPVKPKDVQLSLRLRHLCDFMCYELWFDKQQIICVSPSVSHDSWFERENRSRALTTIKNQTKNLFTRFFFSCSGHHVRMRDVRGLITRPVVRKTITRCSPASADLSGEVRRDRRDPIPGSEAGR